MRELAQQVSASISNYGQSSNLKHALIYGGVKMLPQIRKLKRGVDLIVATPGRLLDHLRSKNVNLNKVEHFILDEADRMLDMGFLPDINQINEVISDNRQTLLFSATYSKEIKDIAAKILKNHQKWLMLTKVTRW